MIEKFQIKGVQQFRGCKAGLEDKTALVTLAWEGSIEHWPAAEARLRDKVIAYRLQEPLSGVSDSDWPNAFLCRPSKTPGLADWVIALSVALQRWARDPVWQGQVLRQTDNQMTLAVPYVREAVLRQGLPFALKLLLLWTTPQSTTTYATKLYAEVEAWLERCQAGGLAPNTLRFALSARARKIPVEAQVAGTIQLGWGRHARKLDSSFSDATPNIATRLARNKLHTNRLLSENAVPVPAFRQVADWAGAERVAQQFGWPVVVKPSNQDQGLGVVPDIRDEAALRSAFEQAAKYSPGAVIVEKHIEGDDHRMLVVGGELRMATRRIPAGVVGDGQRTISQLMEEVNCDPRRGTSKRSLLIRLALDAEAQHCLAQQGLTAKAIPAAGQFVRLRRTANISTGGTAVDVTREIHPDNARLAERAARIVGLDIAGVDFLCPDIGRSWREVGGAICEVNGQPGFRVHWLGDPGRDINGEVVEWLFRHQAARIPTAAITGTNGKSTVAMMLHHIWLNAGKRSGVTTTAGTWVGHELISQDNLSGQPGAKLLLNDPAVEVAVLEMPRKGLIVFGHACDRYDVAALLNVRDDHIGADGIETLEQMAQLKAEVLERATQAIVLNAEDALCMAMRTSAGCERCILVASHGSAPALLPHLAYGGEAVFVQVHQQVPWIVMAQGAEQKPLMPLHDIPATMNGLLKFNEQNALFAVALAWAQGLAPEIIRGAIATFSNSAQQHPGRYNFIEGLPFELLVDFAHNPDGVEGLLEVVRQRPVTGRRWLVNMMVGNRSRSHLTQCLGAAVSWFDEFVLSARPDVVAKAQDWAGDDPMTAMLEHGRQSLVNQGVAADAVRTFEEPGQAILHALIHAQVGDQVVMLAMPWVALPVIEQWRNAAGLTAKLP